MQRSSKKLHSPVSIFCHPKALQGVSWAMLENPRSVQRSRMLPTHIDMLKALDNLWNSGSRSICAQITGQGRPGMDSQALVAPTWLACPLGWLELSKDNAWNMELNLSLDTGIKFVVYLPRRLRRSLSLGVPVRALSCPTPPTPRQDDCNWNLTESRSILAKPSSCNHNSPLSPHVCLRSARGRQTLSGIL